MSTTAASTNPPPHAPQASQTGVRPAHLQGQRTQAPADLFAALLALAADATDATDGSEPLAATPDDAAHGDEQRADDHDNPLAGLMFWQPRGPLEQNAARSSADGAIDTARGDSPREPSVNSTRSDTADTSNTIETTGTAVQPASPRASGPSWQVMATRAAQTAPAGAGSGTANGTGSEAPATRWQRVAPDTHASTPAWGQRSTVTLDPRFPTGSQGPIFQPLPTAADRAAAPAFADEMAPIATGARVAGGDPAPAAANGPSAQADLAGGGEGGDAGETPPGSDNPGEEAQAHQGGDAEAVEVQHWGGAHGLRHASLRVGEDAARAIDIQLALRGDEVQLDIRTDDSAAREALREQAQAALGERLQQGGLHLGNVSVGAQHQERQREGHTPTVQTGRAPGDDHADPAAVPQARTAERAGGLDLFI
jgi:hypothetical protein